MLQRVPLFEKLSCVGLRPSRASDRAWSPCRRPALPGDCFCESHRAALDGLLFGLFQWELHREIARIETRNREPIVACPSCGALWAASQFLAREAEIRAEEARAEAAARLKAAREKIGKSAIGKRREARPLPEERQPAARPPGGGLPPRRD